MTQQTERRLRELFARADQGLGSAPLSLDAIIRSARRRRALRAIAVVGAAAVTIAVAGYAATTIADHPQVREIVPAQQPTAATACAGQPYVATTDPGQMVVDESAVRKLVDDFMRARMAGTGAESCLTVTARAQYAAGAWDILHGEDFTEPGPLCLYACGPTKVTGYRIEDVSPLAPQLFAVTVAVQLETPDAGTLTDRDHLVVGPGATSDHRVPALLVRSATSVADPRAEKDAAAQAGCQDPASAADGTPIPRKAIEGFVSRYMAARTEGWGAEECLSQQALEQYRREASETYPPAGDGPGPLCLYACGRWKVSGYRADLTVIQAADANSYEVVVTIIMRGPEGATREDTDVLAVGPGTAASGYAGGLVVRGARSDQ